MSGRMQGEAGVADGAGVMRLDADTAGTFVTAA